MVPALSFTNVNTHTHTYIYFIIFKIKYIERVAQVLLNDFMEDTEHLEMAVFVTLEPILSDTDKQL